MLIHFLSFSFVGEKQNSSWMCSVLLHVEEIGTIRLFCSANKIWKKEVQPSSWSHVSSEVLESLFSLWIYFSFRIFQCNPCYDSAWISGSQYLNVDYQDSPSFGTRKTFTLLALKPVFIFFTMGETNFGSALFSLDLNHLRHDCPFTNKCTHLVLFCVP